MKRILIIVIILFSIISCSISRKTDDNSLKTSPYRNSGFIGNRTFLDSTLNLNLNQKVINAIPLIIIYYPGKDLCNSKGTATRESIKNWYDNLEDRIQRITPSNLLYIYKDPDGLFGSNDGYKKWYRDPNSIIENLFFKKDPICSGYVIITKEGKFYSKMAEFSQKELGNDLKYLIGL